MNFSITEIRYTLKRKCLHYQYDKVYKVSIGGGGNQRGSIEYFRLRCY